MKSLNKKQVSAKLASMTRLNKSHNKALKQLSVDAIENIDNDIALDQIEKSAVTLSKYKRNSSKLISLMKSDSEAKRISAELLADAKRVLRVKDYAKFTKLVTALQNGSNTLDTGLLAFARAINSIDSDNVTRGQIDTALAKFGRAYKNNVASGERLLRALGLHTVELSGRTITGFAITDVDGYQQLRDIINK